MRKLLIVAAVGLIATPAFSADMAVKAPPPPPAPVSNWTGFYIGGHIGYGWEHVNTNTFNDTGALVDTTSSDRRGPFGGGQAGFNWMFAPTWVLGVEGDISAADIHGDTFNCAATGCASSTNKGSELASVRGRLGYVANNTLMIYGTGGWGWSHSSSDRTVVCVVAGGGVCPGGPSPSPLTGMSAIASGSQGGWTAGGGLEWMFAPHWTAKVEYLHYQFNDIQRNFSYPGFPTAFRHNVSDASLNTVRVGVNYLFNFGPGP